MKSLKSIAKIFTVFTLFLGLSVFAQSGASKKETKMVGGAAMYPTKNIIENAVNSKDHTTLVAAVKAADLVETLSGKVKQIAPVIKFLADNESNAMYVTEPNTEYTQQLLESIGYQISDIEHLLLNKIVK